MQTGGWGSRLGEREDLRAAEELSSQGSAWEGVNFPPGSGPSVQEPPPAEPAAAPPEVKLVSIWLCTRKVVPKPGTKFPHLRVLNIQHSPGLLKTQGTLAGSCFQTGAREAMGRARGSFRSGVGQGRLTLNAQRSVHGPRKHEHSPRSKNA